MSAPLPHGHRIRELRIERGWNQDDLAERTGTTKATISKIERSMMKLSMDWVAKLAAAFGIAPQALVSDSHSGPRLVPVPIIGKIAAGNWREAIQDPVGWVAAVNVGPNAFALVPEGTSMNKLIPDGAYVVIDPDDTALRDGKVYAVMNEDSETTVKMYRAEPARLVPLSTDPQHVEFLLGGAPFTIVGRATSIVQDV